MTDQTTAIVPTGQEQAVIRLVLDGLGSTQSRRTYGRALSDFLVAAGGRGGGSSHGGDTV
jgi:hypothetical protein